AFLCRSADGAGGGGPGDLPAHGSSPLVLCPVLVASRVACGLKQTPPIQKIFAHFAPRFRTVVVGACAPVFAGVRHMTEREIVIAALEIGNAADRAAYLQGRCGQDTPLRQRVELLLQEHDGLGNFLESSPVGVQAMLSLPEFTERPGTTIGSYKL